MTKVVNLNRFRKKKAKEAKERRAEQNRRLHGRTTAERTREEYEKRRLDKKLDGALLIPERIDLDALSSDDPGQALAHLERATRKVVSLSEFSVRLAEQRVGSSPDGSKEPEQSPTTGGANASRDSDLD